MKETQLAETSEIQAGAVAAAAVVVVVAAADEIAVGTARGLTALGAQLLSGSSAEVVPGQESPYTAAAAVEKPAAYPSVGPALGSQCTAAATAAVQIP